MFGATILSAILHAVGLIAAVIVWPYVSPPSELPSDIVPVDLLTVADITNVAPQQEAEKAPPAPEPLPMPEMAAAPEPPPPPPDDAEALALEPPPDEIKEPPPEPPKPQPRFALAVPRAKPKPDAKKPEFDLSQIDKAIERAATEKPKAEQRTATPAATKTLKGAGAQSALTASEIDALKAKLAKCWNVPVGAPDPESLVFRVRVSLNEDGTVAAPPQLVDQGRLSDPYFRAAADAAIRAINICGPYDLPPEKYAGQGGWNEITIEFDPRKMSGY